MNCNAIICDVNRVLLIDCKRHFTDIALTIQDLYEQNSFVWEYRLYVFCL